MVRHRTEQQYERNRVVNREWYKQNKVTKLAKSRLKHQQNRKKLFDILGHYCSNCGFSDKRALQFDHINGGGRKEIRKFGHFRDMLKFYINDPVSARQNLQVLCANCNWIKRVENNEVQAA